MQVTFENICKMFMSMEPSPLTEEMDAWFAGLLGGLRAFPLDLPGTAFRRALTVQTYNPTVSLIEIDQSVSVRYY